MISDEVLKVIFISVGVIMSLIWPFLVYYKVTENNETIDKDCEK
jgi:branched-subunit amino acid transport protein AzlD